MLLQSPKRLNKELCTLGLTSASTELVVLSNCICDDQALHIPALISPPHLQFIDSFTSSHIIPSKPVMSH